MNIKGSENEERAMTGSIYMPKTKQDSFQACLEDIFRTYGIGVLHNTNQMIELLEDADSINQKTCNIFRTILMSEAVERFISYAENQIGEETLMRDCISILQDDWGLSPEAFVPIITQIKNAADKAVKKRRDDVGKTICNQLKEMRRRFAQANHIEYEENDCEETRPCAGTCPYCEERTKHLVEEAKKIAAVRNVIYPQISDDEIRDDRYSTGIKRDYMADGQIEIDPEMLACGEV